MGLGMGEATDDDGAPRGSAALSIWALPLIALAIIAGTLVWFGYDEYNQTIAREFRALDSNARIAEALISGLLRNIEQLLDEVARERESLSPSQSAGYDSVLAERLRRFPEMRSLVVINAEGIVESTATPKLKGFDSSRRDYFVAHLAAPLEPNFHVSRPFKTATSGDISIAFSVAIRDQRRKLRGMVVSGVDPSFFESVLRQVMPEGGDATALLFNRFGDVVYRLPDPDRYREMSIPDGSNAMAHIRSGAATSWRIGVSATDRVKRVTVVKRVGDTGLSVGVSRRYDDVVGGWYQNLAARAAVLLISIVLIGNLTLIARRRQRERERAEATLREAVDRLTVSNTELERFAYVASHDLQEPLRGIVSFTQLVQRNLGDRLPPAERENFGFVISAAKRMSQLIQDMLAFSRISRERINFAAFPLGHACADAIENLRAAIADSGATVTVGELPTVTGDSLQLMQIFQNLIGNAIKFHHPDRPPRVSVSAARREGEWVVSVEDNGIGVAETGQDVFELFRRLHAGDAYPGSGVGLAVCKRIVTAHKGRIWFESTKGRGATFRFTLPADPATA